MAGHSKWAGIKHKKAIVDAQRGKVFSKVIREITAAARLGGGNPEANPRLRLAMQKAKEANLPKDSLEKAIKRGTGDLPGVAYEEMVIEGYGPGGVAILVEALSDNRTVRAPRSAASSPRWAATWPARAASRGSSRRRASSSCPRPRPTRTS
jgi:YebC/PmpR family DNA-binding regulatory protein